MANFSSTPISQVPVDLDAFLEGRLFQFMICETDSGRVHGLAFASLREGMKLHQVLTRLAAKGRVGIIADVGKIERVPQIDPYYVNYII